MSQKSWKCVGKNVYEPCINGQFVVLHVHYFSGKMHNNEVMCWCVLQQMELVRLTPPPLPPLPPPDEAEQPPKPPFADEEEEEEMLLREELLKSLANKRAVKAEVRPVRVTELNAELSVYCKIQE